jgi:hypothetical protein
MVCCGELVEAEAGSLTTEAAMLLHCVFSAGGSQILLGCNCTARAVVSQQLLDMGHATAYHRVWVPVLLVTLTSSDKPMRRDASGQAAAALAAARAVCGAADSAQQQQHSAGVLHANPQTHAGLCT